MSDFLPVLCLNLLDEQSQAFVDFFPSETARFTTLAPTSGPLTEQLLQERWERVSEVGPLLTAFSQKWPESSKEALDMLMSRPTNAAEWRTRNMVLLAAIRNLFWVVDEISLSNLDLTQHLMAAKVVGALRVGLLPGHARTSLDTTQMTMSDILVVTQEPRSVELVMATLKGEHG